MIALALAAALAQPPAAGEVGQDVSVAFAKLLTGDERARVDLQRLAEQGRFDAASVLSEIYLTTAKTQADLQNGCHYAEKAADVFAAAKHNLARCVETGVNSPPDPVRAAKLYEQAGAAGFVASKCALGSMLIAGRGVAKDEARGLALCGEAAAAGNSDAQIDLGNIYLTGRGAARDPVKARGWFEQAVAQGHPAAAFMLGQIYWNGDGVAKNPPEAVRYWRMAYDKGRLDAAKLLGDEAFVRMSRGAEPDRAALDEAIGWYEKAIAAGASGPARAQIDEALKLARDLKAELK